jgi:hypothetical protein
MCGKVYGIVENTTLVIMKKYCVVIKKHLKSLVIPKLIKRKSKEIMIGFESLHGIPNILNAIDGSHISIIVLKIDPKLYIIGTIVIPSH